MFAASKTAGAVSAEVNYIEDVFSTYLYTGNGSTQTITNGIDLSGKGGLYWWKVRNIADSNYLVDTTRGATKWLVSNSTGAEQTVTTSGLAFNNSGVSFNNAFQEMNQSGNTFTSWTFRKQPKFFDVVTWTGDGTGNINIPHNLGSVPGCIMMKKTSAALDWYVYHRDLNYPNAGSPQSNTLKLNTTDAGLNSTAWQSGPTSTYFPVLGSAFNVSGATYVAYLFAHNAGGFGLTGTDNVISCGSFTTDSSGNATVSLGYEPQYILMKKTSGVQSWVCYDTMRGWAQAQQAQLYPNITQAEDVYTGSPYFFPTATGFSLSGTFGLGNNDTFIYIAIRRGPMKVPTSGTSVFSPIASTGTTGTAQTTDFPVDLQINRDRANTGNNFTVDRLRGVNTTAVNTGQPTLWTNATNAENSNTTTRAWGNTGFQTPSVLTSLSAIYWNFRRAPSFFDEVCYTGNGVNARAITHNLGVAPEMIIVKKRTGADGWVVWASGLTSRLYELYLNDPRAQFVEASPRLNVNNAPTSTQFEVGTDGEVNASGATYVSYLFASCPGVSKVGSYTGTGATQTISCGLVARFVLIKRTDSTGNWFVWDTARGMVAGTDPRLALNSTAAESNANWVYTDASGFQIVTTDASVNASGGTYIYLAIA